MSASSEKLLLQIVELEQKLLEAKSKGENFVEIEETLESLKYKFTIMNEALNEHQGILKG